MIAAWLRRATVPLRSSFARHAGILSGGQFVSAGISILAAPVLGRLYPPADYGVLATYMAVASVLGSLTNWQYSQAIIVERSDARAFALVRVCLIASALTACAAALIGVALALWPADDHALHSSAAWFLLLPASVMSAGMVAAWSALANRLARYRMMATSQALSAVVTVALSMSLGWLGWGPAGLMIAYFAGQAYFMLVYGLFWLRLTRPPAPSRRRVIALARRHRHFAMWTTPSMFVGQFAMQIPIYLLGVANALALVGAFSRGRQLLLLPLGLIGQAIAQVFRQRAAADYARYGNCTSLFRKASLGLLVLGLPPTILLMAMAPWLFGTFLGPHWRVAGDVARLLAPMLLLQLVCSPVSSIYYIVGRQREDAAMQVAFALITALLSVLPLACRWPVIWVVGGYAVGQSLMYLAYLLRCWQFAHGLGGISGSAGKRKPPNSL